VTNTVDTALRIPRSLLPADGRFGSGPSKVGRHGTDALDAAATTVLGTSHRQPAVKDIVARIRSGLRDLFHLPDGYEVVLGNGGTTVFWDIAAFCLVQRRSQHLAFGEFSSRFAKGVERAPHLEQPTVIQAYPGQRPTPRAEAGVDLYALTHNETSTGVAMTPYRPSGMDPGALIAVDATSAAGGLRFDPREVDAYYFAPQKCFASDGGLWLAVLSPAAVDRVGRISTSGRWVPASLDLGIAMEQSRQDQTYNTPALATLVMLAAQLDWMLAGGGLEFAASRCDRSATTLYGWAASRPWAAPFVTDPADRSRVVATIDFDPAIDGPLLARTLRANGILDVEPYRKLGRNQLRVAMFPAIDPEDIEALTACIDHVVERII
jgi:phosphoserine aminotransferase